MPSNKKITKEKEPQKVKIDETEDETEIVTIIDRSGSMQSVVDDAIGGFNSFLEQQKRLPGKATFTLIEFNQDTVIKYNGVNISEVKPYTLETYIPMGSTALYDAIGLGVGEAARRGENRKVIVAILTDGHENSSKEVNRQQVGDMIEKYTKNGWVFMFLATGFSQFDAERIASSISINKGMAMGASRNSSGQKAMYSSMNNAAASYRCSGSVDARWKK